MLKAHEASFSTAEAASRKPSISKVVSKIAKKVNLSKEHLSLSEKQDIFESILSQHSKKKVPKKEKKKQRYLIRKVLIVLLRV